MSPRDAYLKVIEAVATKYGFTVRDIMGRKRTAELSTARFEAYHRVKQSTGYSLPHIGRIFGRDHTTILSGLRKYEERKNARVEKAATVCCPLCGSVQSVS